MFGIDVTIYVCFGLPLLDTDRRIFIGVGVSYAVSVICLIIATVMARSEKKSKYIQGLTPVPPTSLSLHFVVLEVGGSHRV